MKKIQFLKIENIAGMHYSRGSTQNLVIYGIGAPIPPDNGTLPDADLLLKYDVDIFVPDYIGYGRSDGEFTPLNCIQTFLDLYTNFQNGCIGYNGYLNTKTHLKYERIIFIGRSFGGTYIPLLPRFNKEITELAIFCPVVDSKSCGSIRGEETNADFLRSMRNDGYHHLYRGVLSKEWVDHLENKDDLSPMENIKHLENVRMFIAHGKRDMCVHFSKSKKYHRRILKNFPSKAGQYKMLLVENGDHGPTTTNVAAANFMQWLKVKKRSLW